MIPILYCEEENDEENSKVWYNVGTCEEPSSKILILFFMYYFWDITPLPVKF